MLSSLWTERRMRLYPLAILAGVVLGFVVFVATSQGLRTFRGGRMGGDFPAFYAAARIVRFGNPQTLYDPATQRSAQQDLLPGIEGGWAHFAYPPYVAIAYLPFTLVGFKAAYLLHTVLMAGCCVGALRMLRTRLPRLDRYYLPAVAATLTFYPLCRSIMGGQNTAVSLLCAAGCAAATASRRDVLAGVWLGIWLFKPQLALPVAGFIAFSGHPRVLIGLTLVAVAWYLLGASTMGLVWPILWWQRGVLPFVSMDRTVDRGNGVSFGEVTADLGIPWLGPICVAATAIYMLRCARRWRHDQIWLMGAATAAAVLIAPHALYYDGGLAILALMVIGARAGRAAIGPVCCAWLLAGAQFLRPFVPLPPVMLALMLTLWLCAHESLRLSRQDTVLSPAD